MVESLYDYNIDSKANKSIDLLVEHLKVNIQLEKWKDSLPEAFTPLHSVMTGPHSLVEIESAWTSILFSLHYRRAQLLMHRPIITMVLKIWVLGAAPPRNPLADTLPALFAADYDAAGEIIRLVTLLLLADDGIFHRHAIWFLANYSGNAIPMNIDRNKS